jgi:hypothetical protein
MRISSEVENTLECASILHSIGRLHTTSEQLESAKHGYSELTDRELSDSTRPRNTMEEFGKSPPGLLQLPATMQKVHVHLVSQSTNAFDEGQSTGVTL